MKKILVVTTLVLLGSISPCCANSIWKSDSASFFSTQRSFKVGDIITVVVIENASAVSKAGTDTKVSDALSAQISNNIGRLSSLMGTGTHNVGGSLSNRYEGSGKTLRSNVVTGKVSAKVTELLPNGNLKIEGFHAVEVNNETQTLGIQGVIRSKDVTQQNTIFSYQVADAQVKVVGSGIVDEASTPGFLTRILNWIF